MTSIVTRILDGTVKVWNVIETEIENDYAKVKAELPASGQTSLDAEKSDLKQAASDALSAAASAEATYAPQLAKVVEGAADSALAAVLGGYSVPLVPLLNGGIDKIVATATATLQAWALKAKADAAAAPIPASTAGT